MGYGRQVHFPVYQRLQETTVTAVSDTGSGKARALANELPYPIAAYSDGLELIASKEVDLVSIATPPEFHFDLIGASLKAHKNVICEKPFTTSLEQVEMLAGLLQNSKARLCVGYEFPYDAAFIEMRKQTKSGAIGEVQRIKVEWLTSSTGNAAPKSAWKASGKPGTGLLYDWCCHIFDYSTQIIGSSIEWIFCKRHSEYELDILCQFVNDTVGHFVVANNYHTDLGHKITLLGTKGRLSLAHLPPYRGVDKSLELHPVTFNRQIELPVLHSYEKEYPDNRMAAFEELVGQFVVSPKDQQPTSYPDVNRALAVWKILNAAEQSFKDGCLTPIT